MAFTELFWSLFAETFLGYGNLTWSKKKNFVENFLVSGKLKKKKFFCGKLSGL